MEPPPYTDQSIEEERKAPAAHHATPEDQGASPSNAPDTSIEEVPAPPYSSTYGEMDLSQGGFGTSTRIAGALETMLTLYYFHDHCDANASCLFRGWPC